MRRDKFAILVPSYQAGNLLIETLESAAKAGLPPDSYEFVVSDNASTDGSIERVTRTDPQGAPITLLRNATNIGRVQNWNRLADAAEEMGFGYATFLMAGDLVHGAGFITLRDVMEAAGAALGMGYYHVVDENLAYVYSARRLRWNVSANGIAPKALLSQSAAVGAMLHGPLCANLYCLKYSAGPRFDPASPSHTDQRATYTFAYEAARPIVYVDQPVVRWRRRPGRFHATLDHVNRGRDDLRLVDEACREAGIVPDWRKVRAALILRTLFHSGYSFSALRPVIREIGWSPLRVSWSWMLRLSLNKIFYGTPWSISFG